MSEPGTLAQVESFGAQLASLVDGLDASWDELARDIDNHLRGESTALGQRLAEIGALHDPHIFGWVHQHLGTAGRSAAFQRHTKHESKHADSVVATQIYTPRWVAQLLVRRALEGAPELPSIVDPACGGGQFLLVSLAELTSRGAPVLEALEHLRGIDLDPTAVEAARLGLVHEAVRLGTSVGAAREIVDRNIVTGDGLDLAPDSADVVLTNPPYMGHRAMPPGLSERLKRDFRPYHLDLAVAFIDRCVAGARHATAILSQQNVWFLSRFEDARSELLERGHIDLFVHFGPHLFDVLRGEKASVVGFVMRREDAGVPTFFDLRDVNSAEAMRAAVEDGGYQRDIMEVTRLPGAPIAHWVPDRLLGHFGGGVARVGDLFEIPGSQNKTGANRTYVRPAETVTDIAPLDAAASQGERWRYYSKGGRFAPWWGNWDWAVDWSDEAREFYATNRTSNLLRDEWIDREGLVYTDFGGSTFNARWKPATALFDMAGPAIFHPEDDPDALAALLVFLNSGPARTLLNALNPSLHYQVRDVRQLPLPGWDPKRFAPMGRELVQLTREALSDPSRIDELQRAEKQAHQAVCECFGVEPTGDLPRHHRLRD